MSGMTGAIFFTERNIHGAWVIYGTEGVKQYYGYTKNQAVEKYKQEFREVENERKQNGRT